MGLLARLFGKRHDNFHYRGRVKAQLIRDGKVIKEANVHNLVVDDGIEHITSLLSASAQTAMTHMAVGDSAQAPAAGDAALVGTELGRVAFDSKTLDGKSITYVATFPAGTATGTIREAGIFNAATNGVMLARVLPTTFVKDAADIFILTWTLTGE